MGLITQQKMKALKDNRPIPVPKIRGVKMKLSEKLKSIIHNDYFIDENLIASVQALEEKAAKFDELTKAGRVVPASLPNSAIKAYEKAANWDLLEKLPDATALQQKHYLHIIYRVP